MRDFDKSFKRAKFIIYGVWIFMSIMIVAGIIVTIVFGSQIANSPEQIGEFFGKIIKGLNQAK